MLISKLHLAYFLVLIKIIFTQENEEVPICGGFIEFDESNQHLKTIIDMSSIIVNTLSSDLITKEQTNVAQSGYFFLPIYEQESIILRVSAPFGMSFEPEQYVLEISEERRIEDICKEDLNFKFRGYKIEGQISTFGSLEGPEGIEINIYKESDKENVIQSTVTVEGGKFSILHIYPGNYLLKPANESDKDIFDPKHLQLAFEVKVNQSNYLEKALIVRGYKVSGKVNSLNTPLEGVYALIYSFSNELVSNYQCENLHNIKLLNHALDKMVPFCVVRTNSNGEFRFVNIPFGKFIVKTYYKDDLIQFNFLKETMTFEVTHKDYSLEESF